MSKQAGNQEVPTCPQCGASRVRQGALCWLCGAEVPPKPLVSGSHARLREPERFSFSLSTLMLLVTLASVTLGILTIHPGLGVFVGILLLPVLVRTIRVVRAREALGLDVQPAEKIGMFLTSFGVAAILAFVVATAAFTSFCGVCLLMVASDRHYGGPGVFAWGIGMCALALLAFFAMVHVIRWIRRRYRRDTTPRE